MSASVLGHLIDVRRIGPRRSVRLRLTLLYSGLFTLAGAVLLTITYLLVANDLVGPKQVVRLPAPNALFYGQAGPSTASRSPLPQALIVTAGGSKSLALINVRQKLQSAVANERANELDRLLLVSGIALALMALASAGIGWLVAGRVLRPLRTMTARARHISDQNLHERLALDGPDDELKELGDTFDDVLSRLESAFDEQRRFVANASHELRTPLTLERTMIEVALADPDADAESLRRTCERVLVAGEEQERLLQGLLTLARSQRGLELDELVDLREISAGVLERVRDGALQDGLRVQSELETSISTGDPRLIERLVTNLLDNAVRHNVSAGWIDVRTGLDAGHATLTVSNSGRRIDPAELDGLLEPFRRAGADRAGHYEGHGLGLSIVAAIAAAHRAALTVSARREGGLDVRVSFPPRAA